MRKRAPSDFARIFDLHSEMGRPRTSLLLGTLIAGIANTLITGTLYTGFLSENGIDIVSVGIITFIPYLSWVFALFGPQLLSRFKKRKALLLCNHFFYYGTTVLATTIMPRFVADPGRRTLWFGILLFLGNTVNALFGSGIEAWHVHFLPADSNDRNVYFGANNLVSNLTSTVAALGAAMLADAMAGSAYQAQVLIIMRYISFGLFALVGVLHLGVPKEFPYVITRRYRLRDVLLTPLADKRFVLTIALAVFWNCIGNLNAGTWGFYLLNTVGAPYLMTYIATFACAIGSIFLMRLWRQTIRRYNWVKVLFVNVLVCAGLEIATFFVTSRTLPLLAVISFISGINLVGAQLTTINVFYYNLPKVDTDLYVTFYNFAVYIFIFLGAMLGTWMLSGLEVLGDHIRAASSLPIYGSQLLLIIKASGYVAMCFYIRKAAPHILHAEDA